MSKIIEKKIDSSSHKDLLYPELLNTSVTEHVQELLQKKEKSTTFPVQRSSVLGRASKLLQSLKETENDVQNIEIVEEGEPVIDMSVTLVDRDEEYEYESDSGTRSEDYENKTKDRKIICCDSDSDMSENGSEAKVYDERSMPVSSDSESDVSENESEGNVVRNVFPFSNIDIKDYEKCVKTVNDLNVVTSSDSDDNTEESKMNVLKETKVFSSNSSRKQFDNKNVKTVLGGKSNDKFVDSDDELSNQECRENKKKSVDHPELDLELTTSVSPDPKYQNHNPLNKNLDLSGERKRKLISVIEEGDDQHTSLSTKQKRV